MQWCCSGVADRACRATVRMIVGNISSCVADEVALAVSPDTILVRSTEPVATTMVDGNVVVLSIRAGSYFDFNRVGSEIWTLLGEPQRVTRILDVLGQNYDVDRDTLTRDVVVFLQNLVEARLVSVLAPEEKTR